MGCRTRLHDGSHGTSCHRFSQPPLTQLESQYQAEAAPPAIRGAIVSFYQLSITIGILVSQLVDLGTEKIQSTASWRVPIGLQMVFALMLFGGCLLIVGTRRRGTSLVHLLIQPLTTARVASFPLQAGRE